MKKLVILIVLTLFLTGCGTKRNTIIDNNSQSSFFQIASDYKKGKAGFYIINSSNCRLDTKAVELGLMDISADYFNINNTYYQTGQYLDRKTLKSMINEINKNKITFNNNEYNLPIINYIYETNYLGASNKLKGVSIAVALNSHFMIDGAEVTIDDKTLINFVKENNQDLIKIIRQKTDLEKTRIVMGLFKLNKNTSELPGVYIAKGVTSGNKVNNFNTINNKIVIMNTPDFKNIDEVNYKAYYTLDTVLHSKYKSLLINGTASYENNNVVSMDITVNVGAVSISSVMAIGQDIINEVNKSFSNKNIKIIIKNDNRDAAFIIFNDYNKNGNIYLLP